MKIALRLTAALLLAAPFVSDLAAADKKKPATAPVAPGSYSPVAKYDLNKNGILEPDEIALIEKDAALMEKYDLNKNGKIDEGERSAMQDSLKAAPGAGMKKKK